MPFSKTTINSLVHHNVEESSGQGLENNSNPLFSAQVERITPAMNMPSVVDTFGAVISRPKRELPKTPKVETPKVNRDSGVYSRPHHAVEAEDVHMRTNTEYLDHANKRVAVFFPNEGAYSLASQLDENVKPEATNIRHTLENIDANAYFTLETENENTYSTIEDGNENTYFTLETENENTYSTIENENEKIILQ
ncbi:hypothetical protein [Citrobacter portucalensis]|uniref:hypothetical protein n=1 Tax=Citrobacter portucalensis TaxID=1639133 RepID=UPI00226B8598|nr:hypothetical protein [Citrobacter portucalensis]MCX8986076.1 hypothetical protein [Citrobacter portucalensis]